MNDIAQQIRTDREADDRLKKKVMLLSIGVGGVLALVLVIYLMSRDTFENDQRQALIGLLDLANKNQKLGKHEESLANLKNILSIVGTRQLHSPELVSIQDEARTSIAKIEEEKAIVLKAKIEAEKSKEAVRMEEEVQRRINDEVAKRIAEEKQKQIAERAKKPDEPKRPFGMPLLGTSRAKTETTGSASIMNSTLQEDRAKYELQSNHFIERLERLEASIEVGMNFQIYSEKLADLNYESRKWKEVTLNCESSRKIESAMTFYISAKENWETYRGSAPETASISKNLMNKCWQSARDALKEAKSALKRHE